MKYKGKIFEAYNVHINALVNHSGQPYIAYDTYLYRLLENGTLERELDFKRRQEIKFFQDGLWLCNNRNFGHTREASEFVDFYRLGKQHPAVGECLSDNSIPILNNKVYSRGKSEADGDYFCSHDLETGQHKVVSGKYFHSASDGQFIFVRRNRPKVLECFDLDLNQLWEFPIEESGSKASQYPQFDGELVFIAPKKVIFAINKGTGELEWQYEFEYPPTSFTVGNGRVYCANTGQMIVLDAQTGDVLVQEDTGLAAFDTRVTYIQTPTDLSLTPIGDDLLYVGSNYDSAIKIFSADGKNCLQTIDLQSIGYPWGSFTQPLVVGDKIFQKLGSDHSEYGSGILMLQPVNDDSDAGIEIEARPEILIYATPNLEEKHSYQIYVEGSALDLLDRYCGIALVELLYETARSPSLEGIKEGAFDNRHDGNIELIVDPDTGTGDVDSIMQSMIEDVMGFIALRNIVTAKGNLPISISYRCQKKQEWSKEGEYLDLEKARAEGKPLN